MNAVSTDDAVINAFFEKRDSLRKFTETHTSKPDESVYEQSLRYGKIAFEAYKISMHSSDSNWDHLPEIQKVAWIEVGVQIEKAVLKDN